MAEDGFPAVKEEVESALAAASELHERWLAEKSEWASSELLTGLRNIEWDLQDLEDAVSIVEGNRAKFDLSAETLVERHLFISTTRERVLALRAEVEGNATGFVAGKKGSMGKYGKLSGEQVEQPSSPPGGPTAGEQLPPAGEEAGARLVDAPAAPSGLRRYLCCC